MSTIPNFKVSPQGDVNYEKAISETVTNQEPIPHVDFTVTREDGILTLDDFAVNFEPYLINSLSIGAFVGFLYVAHYEGDLTVIFYIALLMLAYYFRYKWRYADAVRRELEYYGSLKFPIFIIQVDERTAGLVIAAVEPLEKRFLGISVFYSSQVATTAAHYRNMLKESENEVLKDKDVHEIYYQDVTALVESSEEYAQRAPVKVIKVVNDYKSMLAALKDTEWVKKHFYGQNG